ncbi:MAG: hypothetical protein JWO38_5225 [Gemmataceae bacterium]|nr:hypothetical protein [Gemmataceae bacterium]
MPANKNWYQKAWRALEKRWVQVCITLLAGALVAGISGRLLTPKVNASGQLTDKSRFKFLHCDVCKLEMTYNAELEGKRCPKCVPPNTGWFVGTESSIKAGSGGTSPWLWYNLAVTLELFVTLGVVVYLLYLPVPDPATTFYVFPCPHCRQRLRYRKVSLGGLGQCRRCKRPVRFPDEDQAVPESVVLAQDRKAHEREADAYYAQAEQDD